MDNNILKLIQFIVCYATQHEIKLTTVRLVKFLYLADYYHARYSGGETITGFPWRFVNYGPYCREAMEVIDKAVNAEMILKKEYTGRYSGEYNIFLCEEDVTYQLKELFPPEITSNLQRDIKKLGDDTAALLDYVYFETEPMIDVKKGDILNFSRIRPIEHKTQKTIQLSDEAVKTIKENIKKLGEILREGDENLKRYEMEISELKDDTYFAFLESMEEEPLKTGAKGIVKIVE